MKLESINNNNKIIKHITRSRGDLESLSSVELDSRPRESNSWTPSLTIYPSSLLSIPGTDNKASAGDDINIYNNIRS